jgi:hypothetical protein
MRNILSSLCLLLLFIAAPGARATVLQELGLEELVAGSQLIFRGEALRHAVETDAGLVYTRVWFRVDETVSGEAPGSEFSLRFVGGSTSELDVDVAGQYIPAVGDHAVWFVSDLYDPMVNPLTGWHQGAFPVIAAEDGELLLDLSLHPDLVLRAASADPLARKMLQAGFSEAAIAARVDYQRFPLQDFLDAVRALAGVAP